MAPDLALLTLNAAIVGFVHTLIGPDHYVPFIVMARARRWSGLRTAALTVACGAGHVGSSIALGLVGFAVGASLKKLRWIESWRAEVAAWALIVFGLLYAAWGLWHVRRAAPGGHTHSHEHLIKLHAHDHIHDPDTGAEISLTPWILFAIFVFGPCEPLIPLFIYPAATTGWAGAWLVAAAFALATIATMLTLVLAGRFGLAWLPAGKLVRYQHTLAGATIALTGGLIRVCGL
jgi:sulfite exporter TauE/SafE